MAVSHPASLRTVTGAVTVTTFPSSISSSRARWQSSRTCGSGIGRQARSCAIALSNGVLAKRSRRRSRPMVQPRQQGGRTCPDRSWWRLATKRSHVETRRPLLCCREWLCSALSHVLTEAISDLHKSLARLRGRGYLRAWWSSWSCFEKAQARWGAFARRTTRSVAYRPPPPERQTCHAPASTLRYQSVPVTKHCDGPSPHQIRYNACRKVRGPRQNRFSAPTCEAPQPANQRPRNPWLS